MPTHTAPNVEVPDGQDTRGTSVTSARVVNWLAGSAARAAAAASTPVVRDAEPDKPLAEIRQFSSFVLFGGLFALLAYRPLHYAGIWDQVIVNKLALIIRALTYASDADKTGGVALVDGILPVVPLAAYVLSRGCRAWSDVTRFQARELT
jgi:hypothetical protein